MTKISLILGAGTSKAFGLPLTNEILPRMWKLLNRGRLLKKDQREVLIKMLETLYPGLRQKNVSNYLPNITDVLSMIDHLIVHQNVPFIKFSGDDLTDCRKLLEIAIVEVIEENFYDYDESDPCDKLYDDFINWIYKNRNRRQFNIVSTNYDITIEFGLKYYYSYDAFASKVDFGFSWRDPSNGRIHTPPKDPLFGIYKLHGSTNWLRCDLCNQVYVHIEGNIYHNILYETINDNNTCHCGHGRLSSLIVSPSLERDVRDANVNYVWNRALEQLRTSRDWLMIGYSMPAEDLNIRSILVRAFNARSTKPRITVVQKDENHEKAMYNKARFEAQFGKVDYHWEGLEDFVPRLKKYE